jgi:hypothetical protein
MRSLGVVGILALLAHSSCASATQQAPAAQQSSCPENQVVQVGSAQGVIFRAGDGDVGGYKHGAITEYWTPTVEDVVRAEPYIASYLSAKVPELAAKYSTYIRQYTGFQLDGRKRIFVHFLCWAPTAPGWRCSAVVIDDGGDCYFQLEYDVESHECSKLWVNGSA